MADESKGPPSISAIPPATNNTNDALPERSLSSPSGTTATSSSAGDASSAATGSTPTISKTTRNTSKHHKCANCGARATLRCGGCVEGLDGNGDPSSTYYCNQKCQNDHWMTHKNDCKLAIDRRQLYRIGALVQHAFYVGTKAMWYDAILEARKIDAVLEKDNAVVREVEHAFGASDKDRKEVEYPLGDDSVEVKVRDFGAEDDVVKVSKRKLKRYPWVDGEEVHLRCYKRHDGPDFPAFPTGAMPGYGGGVIEERDEQSMLAASASNGAVVCGLLNDLVIASGSDLKVDEVIIDPGAPRSVRFDWFDSSSSTRSPRRPPSKKHDSSSFKEPDPPKPPIYWIFRATLRDGSQFAIDTCNAQYTFTTKQERSHGVFPWDSYLRRLGVPADAPLHVHEITFHKPKGTVHPVGTLKEGRADFFHDEDIRSTAESMIATQLFATARDLILTHELLLTNIMDRKFNRQAHTNHAIVFKEQLKLDFKERRDQGIKATLMQRLEVKAGVRQRMKQAHWLV